MTTSTKDDDERKWRFVSTVEHLYDRPCRRLHPVTSSSAGDLILVFFARSCRAFVSGDNCEHMGQLSRNLYQRFSGSIFHFPISIFSLPCSVSRASHRGHFFIMSHVTSCIIIIRPTLIIRRMMKIFRGMRNEE